MLHTWPRTSHPACPPLACLAILTWMAWPASAVSTDPMLTEAMATYDEAMETNNTALRLERFRRASRLFGQVTRNRGIQNAALWVSGGNASLQGNELGDAVLAYRRALTLEPAHEQAHKNLEHARAMLPAWVPRPTTAGLFDSFFFWYQSMGPSGRQLTAALAFACAAGLVAVALRFSRRWLRNLAILAMCAWVSLVVANAWDQRAGRANAVVITAPHVVARSADSSGAPPRFRDPLPAGTEALLIARRDAWAHIRLANGRDAWVRANAVTPVPLNAGAQPALP